MIEITVTPDPDQKFAVILNDRRVTMRLRFNHVSERWSMDLSIDDNPVLHGRRIVTGTDLLAAYGFGIGVIFAAEMTPDSKPDRTGLPEGLIKIFHTTDDEIKAVLAS